MDTHKCKLCSRTFSNGKALGGHMKSHLATLPLPPKPRHHPQLTESSPSESSSSSESENEEEEAEQEQEQSLLSYGLRENPRKSFRLSDPESDTESKNPTRRRSSRNRRTQSHQKRPKLSWIAAGSASPASSVSDASPEENVAMCLMMLSRDRWLRNGEEKPKFRCEICQKMFKSNQALGNHRLTHRKSSVSGASKIYECPYCFRIFSSGQALGGHKRSHMLLGSKKVMRESSIDLNQPAPIEEEEEDTYSVVSDCSN